MKSKNNLLIIPSVLVLVILVLLGLTYAYYKTRINGNSKDKSISVTSKKLEITYADGNGVIEGTEKIEPGYTTTKTFTVENTGDATSTYSIKLDNITNTFSRTEDWTYVLKKGETEVSSGVLPTNETYIVNAVGIDSKATDSYSITITYANLTDVDQSIDMGKELSLRVNIDEAVGTIFENASEGTLLKAIGNDNLISKPLTTPGNESSKIIFTANFDDAESSVNLTTAKQSTMYYTYADSYELNQSTGTVTLINPAVGKYSDIYSNLVGKYVVSYSGSSSSTIANSTNRSNIYKITGTSTETTSTLKYIEIKKVATGTEAVLSSTEDDYGTSYYYRGVVDNNFVNFAGMCWRILRVQGDGSIKLILEDQDELCSETMNGNWDIPTTTGGTTNFGNFGYTEYAENKLIATDGTRNEGLVDVMNYLNGETDKENSMITAFENFQTGPLSEYLSYLKSGDWCLNDKAYATDTDNSTPLSGQEMLDKQIKGIKFYYDSYVRLYGKKTKEPTLKCNGTNISKFNDNRDMYVGALTADEVVYAGEEVSGCGIYFLINDYQKIDSLYFWTMSPGLFDVDGTSDSAFVVGCNFNATYVRDYFLSFRPAVSLKSDVQVKSGDGTQKNPYVVG